MGPEDLEHNTADGLHLAAVAGTWIVLVAGLGGMRERYGALQFAPRLPEGITRLAVGLSVQQRQLRITVTPESTGYQLVDGAPLRIFHEGEEIGLSTAGAVSLPTGTRTSPTPPAQPYGREPRRWRGGR